MCTFTFISCVHFLKISISYKRGDPIRLTMGTSYIFNIYMINVVGWECNYVEIIYFIIEFIIQYIKMETRIMYILTFI